MLAAHFAFAIQLANPGFEHGLEGWRVDGHRGMRTHVDRNRFSMAHRSVKGGHFVAMGWRARSGAPDDASNRLSQSIDARPYRGQVVRISAQNRAPDFAQGFGSLIVRAGGTEVRAGITASETWRRHAATLRVPRAARWIEVVFRVDGTRAELAVDDVRFQRLR